MGRFQQSSHDDEGETQIDMSPLMDCVFILLIFFIVTTTFVEETGVEVDKPQAASASNLEKTSILLAVTKDGSVVYGGKDIGVGGVQAVVKRQLQQEDVPVIIQSDQKADFGVAFRVLDEAKLAGANKVSFASAKG